MSKAWKENELWFAKLISGSRAGAVGKEGPDVLHPTLAPECKERKGGIKTLEKWFQQAETNAPPGKTPIVHLHTLGAGHHSDIVCMRVSDWLKFFRAWEDA